MSRLRWKMSGWWLKLQYFFGLRKRMEPPPQRTEPLIDWNAFYVWECRQYRACPTAFWFDHNRFHEQPGQYPDPSARALRRAWDEATDEARAQYGNIAVQQLFEAMAQTPLLQAHPDPSNPFPFLMQHYGIKPSKGRYQTPG